MLSAGVGGQSERLAGRRRKMAVESRVTQEEIKKEPEKPIDREKVRVRRDAGVPGEVGRRCGAGGKGRDRACSLLTPRCPAPRPARCSCASSPPTTAATTAWTSSPAETCPPASCRSTLGESGGRGPACRLRALLGSGPLEAARGRSRFGEEMVLTRLVALRPLTLKLLGCKELTHDCCHCCGCWVRK